MKLFIPILVLAILVISGCSVKTENPKIYVANEGDGTISVIDSRSLEIIKTIKLAGMPHNVNTDLSGKYVFATNHEGEEDEEDMGDMHNMQGMKHTPYLRIIDAKTDELVRSVPMKGMAAHVVPSRTKNTVHISIESASSVVEVNPENSSIINSFEVGSGPHGIVLSNDGEKLYTPNMNSNDVSIVDLNSGKEKRINITFENKTCEKPVAMGITSDDKYSFVTCGISFDIYKIDNIEGKILARVELKKGEPPGPIQIPVHPNQTHLYVPDMSNGVVHKIRISDFLLEKDIKSGLGAHGIAFSPDGKTAYVTNTWENTVSVINLEKDEVVTKIKVGSKPNGIAIQGGKNQGL